MNTFSDIQQQWQQVLAGLYPSREINNLFRFVLEDVFDLSPAEQLVERETVQKQETIARLSGILDRLLTGEPLQYITGFTYFDDLKISVAPGVLIPRPETEELVHWVLESVSSEFSGTITDWCTGSGCIALALKNHLPKAIISGYDWSEEALQQSENNSRELNLEIAFGLKDALSATMEEEPIDIIISNPPYIPEEEMAEMRTNVNDFEPHMALFVPNDNALLFYKAITEKAVKQLNPGGMLFFELHENYAEETKEMVEATGVFITVEIREDLSGKQRMLKAVK